MSKPEQYPYKIRDNSNSETSYLPYLPITLRYKDKQLFASGLMDTGATVNVLPYELGEQLGIVWEERETSLFLSGNLANFEARAVLLKVNVGQFPTVNLAFAWTKSQDVPLILGQVNFFMEFDVCFFRSQLMFEIKAK
jgi:hypothetical protein